MLKSRIEVTNGHVSLILHAVIACFFTVLSYSLLTHPISFSLLQQVIYCLSILLVVVSWRENRKHDHSFAITLDDAGTWIELDAKRTDNTVWQISSKSRVSSLILFIHLLPLGLGKQKGKWCWVIRPCVSESDYRRLCQSIFRRYHTK